MSHDHSLTPAGILSVCFFSLVCLFVSNRASGQPLPPKVERRVEKAMQNVPLVLSKGPVGTIQGPQGSSKVRIFGFSDQTVYVMTPDLQMREVPYDGISRLSVTDGQWVFSPQAESYEDFLRKFRREVGYQAKYGVIANQDTTAKILAGTYKPPAEDPKPTPASKTEVIVQPPAPAPQPEPVPAPAPVPAPPPVVAPAPAPEPVQGMPGWLKYVIGGGIALGVVIALKR